MEPHHLIPLSEIYSFCDKYHRNIDCVENVVSLCPNCHKKIHLSTDVDKIKMVNELFYMRNKALLSKQISVKLKDLLLFYKIKP